jgi:WhiA C-terminal HTH domain
MGGRVIAHNPRLADVGLAANRRRASQTGQQQAALARQALRALQAQTRPTPYRDRWMRALQHRIDNPDAALAELGQTMTPTMTKHAYAALLRRALRGGGVKPLIYKEADPTTALPRRTNARATHPAASADEQRGSVT